MPVVCGPDHDDAVREVSGNLLPNPRDGRQRLGILDRLLAVDMGREIDMREIGEDEPTWFRRKLYGRVDGLVEGEERLDPTSPIEGLR